MMRKRYTSCGLQALRFRRWSRKGYAAFVSRQRACTMGTLRCHIVERLQQKNGMPVAYMPLCDCTYETADALAEETGGVPADWLPAALACVVTACYGVTADAAAPGFVLSVDNKIFPAGGSGLYPGLPAGRFGAVLFEKELLKKTRLLAKADFFLFLSGVSHCHAGALRLPRGVVFGRCHGGFSFLSLERKKRNKESSRAHLTLATSRPSFAKSPELALCRSSNSVAFFTLTQDGLLNASLGKALSRSIAARAPARHLRRREEVTACWV